MTRRLIVNADDWGLTRGVSEGILAAHRHGIVTSTTVLTTAALDTELAARLRDSGLGVGLHVNLTLGTPLTRGKSLTDGHGRFVRDARQAAARTTAADVRAEVDAQVAKFVKTFRRAPTHLDSHHHVGLHPPVREVVLEAARGLGVPVRSQDVAARM
jgi:chitin disaccharide deacetylase